MQVTELESQGLKKNFKIIVDASKINTQMENELRAAGESVKIPGFRPGFIPLKILQQRYGKAVQGDVLKQVINQATTEVLNEKKLRPALTPQVNIDDYKEGGDLAFTITFESFPELPEVDFSNVKLERRIYEISDADIDEALARIAERSPATNRLPEGSKAKTGNVVIIDFKGMINGVPFSGGTADNYKLELGSKQFIEGFEEQLVGAQEGDDRIVKVTFPEDYAGEEVAGKEASFAVKVKEVHEKEIPEINEDFARNRGFVDLRAFREAVRGQMIREYDQLVRNHLKKELFDVLEEKYDFPLPQSMVDMEFNSIWERLKQAQMQGDPSLSGKNDEELREEYMNISRRRVKLGLLLADVGNRNKIQISREELTRAIMQQASMYPGQEKKVMEFYRKNPERVDDLRGPILEEKAVDFVLSKVTFDDRKVTLKELAEEEEDSDSSEQKKEAKATKSAKKEKAAEEAPKKPAKKKAAGNKE